MANLPKRGLMTALALFLVDQVIKWAVTGPMGLRALGDVRESPIFNLRFVPITAFRWAADRRQQRLALGAGRDDRRDRAGGGLLDDARA